MIICGDALAELRKLPDESVEEKPVGDLIEEIRLMENQPVYNDPSILRAALAYKEQHER